jgi:acetylornithine deacetylase/succinyl-diaminopimelate desuccinylase-like protein
MSGEFPAHLSAMFRSAVVTMLENNFTPQRSVVLAFGFDEESSGLHASLYIGILTDGF